MRRGKVDTILCFVRGCPVEVISMLRVGGRYREGRVRPIITKWRSVWDHRLLLATNWKTTKNIKSSSIMTNHLTFCRKAAFDRLKKKYESDCKTVTLSNGYLIIYNEMIFFHSRSVPLRNNRMTEHNLITYIFCGYNEFNKSYTSSP